MTVIYILNGPNLNLLGQREPEVYGHDTLASIEAMCRAKAKGLGLDIVFRQTNIEGELVNHIHEAREKAKGLVINAGAYTHTSVALHDAVKAVGLPTIEVHLSNVYKREAFRHHSYLSPVAEGVICGFGPQSYELALEGLAAILKKKGKA
ncbi:type II 3-dehydroquinate dehydratase [Aestuariivirga litoralis]|uniref:type II 3-dehydroquinate dehydratase n=1 Tax=Aestuariivirga litoralis TaxID=2650924 RepID=UPI0018C7530B|nr:type II 3-dehydroquinate dehydratase [Aestuariivirga litoralis]MBG1231911.1 type II 3-dehydroquinate dehydratase [Aestuariivirga litoralis]